MLQRKIVILFRIQIKLHVAFLKVAFARAPFPSTYYDKNSKTKVLNSLKFQSCLQMEEKTQNLADLSLNICTQFLWEYSGLTIVHRSIVESTIFDQVQMTWRLRGCDLIMSLRMSGSGLKDIMYAEGSHQRLSVASERLWVQVSCPARILTLARWLWN